MKRSVVQAAQKHRVPPAGRKIKRRKQRPSVKQENGAPETQDKLTNPIRVRRRKPAKREEGSTPAEGPPQKEAAHQLIPEQKNQDKRSPEICPKKTPEQGTGEKKRAASPSRRGRKKRKSVNVLSNVKPGRDELAQETLHTGDFGSEQEEIEALVRSLRARAQRRGGREVGSEDELPGGHGGGQGGGEVARCVREAKDKCMWAIIDLLGELPGDHLARSESFSPLFSQKFEGLQSLLVEHMTRP
jgi:hypothetical protein